MSDANPANRILVADDNAEIRMVVQELLELEGYKVDSASNGVECLERVRISPPDLIILDVMMPEMDGVETCQHIKSNPETRHIPIIFLTGQYDYDARINGKKAGADEFLYKPVDATELLIRTRNLLTVKAYHDLIRRDRDLLEQKVLERTTELRHAHEETLIRLSMAAEYKDGETGIHLLRMSGYAELIAIELGVSPSRAQLIRQAAVCHDIGKIGVPESILLKPGPLTDDEWAVMREHTRIGANILSNSKSDLLRLAECIALNHHENWDGTGYPNEVTGENIPFEARIVKVADVFDALTSKRVYKHAYTVDDSLEAIRAGANAQFDPRVVMAFERALEAIMKLRDEIEPILSGGSGGGGLHLAQRLYLT
ncbi:MAG: response regulator [bacterium]|nr:response regulator [bacterium]